MTQPSAEMIEALARVLHAFYKAEGVMALEYNEDDLARHILAAGYSLRADVPNELVTAVTRMLELVEQVDIKPREAGSTSAILFAESIRPIRRALAPAGSGEGK